MSGHVSPRRGLVSVTTEIVSTGGTESGLPGNIRLLQWAASQSQRSRHRSSLDRARSACTLLVLLWGFAQLLVKLRVAELDRLSRGDPFDPLKRFKPPTGAEPGSTA
jgi:hypothetical protein